MDYWKVINKAESHSEIADIIKTIESDNTVDNEEYNDYMVALSQLSRELYQRSYRHER